jgi:hypothetical protein
LGKDNLTSDKCGAYWRGLRRICPFSRRCDESLGEMKTYLPPARSACVKICRFAAKSLRFSSRIPACALLEGREFEARLA